MNTCRSCNKPIFTGIPESTTFSLGRSQLFRVMRERAEVAYRNNSCGYDYIPKEDPCYDYDYMTRSLYTLEEQAAHGWRPECFFYGEDKVDVYMRGFGDNANLYACEIDISFNHEERKVKEIKVTGIKVGDLKNIAKTSYMRPYAPTDEKGKAKWEEEQNKKFNQARGL
jgi:hypothetical protein